MDILHFIKISMQMSRLYKRAAGQVKNVGVIKDGFYGGILFPHALTRKCYFMTERSIVL